MRLLLAPWALALLPAAAAAQTADWAKTTTPSLLVISTETIRPGQEDVHRKVESGWHRLFTKAKFPSWFLGLSSSTGPSTMLFLTGYDSLQASQKDDDDQGASPTLSLEQDKLLIEDSVYLVAKTHESFELIREASREARFPVGAARTAAITRIEVEPAQVGVFRDWLRAQVAERAAQSPHVASYRLFAGGSLATFLVVELRVSRAAFGADHLDWDGGAGVKSITRNLYDVDAATSHVSAEAARGHEKFWFAGD